MSDSEPKYRSNGDFAEGPDGFEVACDDAQQAGQVADELNRLTTQLSAATAALKASEERLAEASKERDSANRWSAKARDSAWSDADNTHQRLHGEHATTIEELREAVRVLGEELYDWRIGRTTRKDIGAVDANPIARAALTPPAPAQEPRA